MKPELKEKFLVLWSRYFCQAELPITFYYSEGDGGAELVEPSREWNCLIGELAKVRKGKSLVFNAGSLGCGGAKRYLGYTKKMRPGFKYFLSCGNAVIEGERYKRTPAMVKELMKQQGTLPAEGKNIVFKRWDQLGPDDKPEVVVFFAPPDVLSGLFTLSNFDREEPNGVFCPFSSGCGSIVHYPYLEIGSVNPRAVIGMFDPSARPCVPADSLSFAVPMVKFERMINYMEESFLITDTWKTVRKRIEKNY